MTNQTQPAGWGNHSRVPLPTVHGGSGTQNHNGAVQLSPPEQLSATNAAHTVRLLLATALKEPDLRQTVFDALPVTDLPPGELQELYKAMRKVTARGGLLDPTTLAAEVAATVRFGDGHQRAINELAVANTLTADQIQSTIDADVQPETQRRALREIDGDLTEARQSAARGALDIDVVVERFLRRVEEKLKPRTRRSLAPLLDEPSAPLPNYDPALYKEHFVLGAIRDHAHSRCVGADATLIASLVLVSGGIPGGILIDSGVRRPTIPGIYGVVNAESGVGKSAAVGVAQDLLDIPVTFSVSTGEGILERYYGLVAVHNEKGDQVGTRREIVRHNALFSADEGQTLFAEMSREGSKFGSILRSFWSGAGVGTANATHDRNRQLPGGTYNGSLVIGLQPSIVGGLIGETALGTAQRFLWCAAHDVHLNPDAPGWDGPLFVPPDIPRDTDGEAILTGEKFTVDASITAELRAAEFAKVTLRAPVDDHDSQRSVQLLKISATLAWMDSRLHVELGDWQLAAAILDESNRVRDALLEVAEQQARDRVTKAGYERAAQRDAEKGKGKAVVEIKARILEILAQQDEPMTRGKLRANAARTEAKRDLAFEAIDGLVADGLLDCSDTKRSKSYTLSQEGRRQWQQ